MRTAPPEEEDEDVGLRERFRLSIEESTPTGSGAPAWVVTFSDMMSLILTFFILLLTFARFDDTARYATLVDSVDDTFGGPSPSPAPVVSPASAPETSSGPAPAPSSDTGQVQQATKKVLLGLQQLSQRHGGRVRAGDVEVEVFEDYRGVVMALGVGAFFDAADAGVRPGSWPFLDDAIELAAGHDSQLEIEVHTDRRTHLTGDPQADDRLAGAQALSIARYFIGAKPDLNRDRLSVRSMGSIRPRFANATEADRARNRRVEFVFSTDATD